MRAPPLPADRADPSRRSSRRSATSRRSCSAASRPGITRVHGQPQQDVTLGGSRVLLYPLYHPAAALYTPAMLKVLEEDFARLPELLGRAGCRARARSCRCSRRPRRARAGGPARPLLGDGARSPPRRRRPRRSRRRWRGSSSRRRRHRLGRARQRQDDLRPRRLPRARRHGAGDEPDLHDRPPLPGRAGRRLAPRPLPLPGLLARPSGATSSRTSRTRSASSSGPRRRPDALPPARVEVRLSHMDPARQADHAG